MAVLQLWIGVVEQDLLWIMALILKEFPEFPLESSFNQSEAAKCHQIQQQNYSYRPSVWDMRASVMFTLFMTWRERDSLIKFEDVKIHLLHLCKPGSLETRLLFQQLLQPQTVFRIDSEFSTSTTHLTERRQTSHLRSWAVWLVGLVHLNFQFLWRRIRVFII